MPTQSEGDDVSTQFSSASPCFSCSVDSVPFPGVDSATKQYNRKLYLTVIKITDLSIVYIQQHSDTSEIHIWVQHLAIFKF